MSSESYRVTTKSGKIYNASEVEHLAGFLKMKCWDGELRIPAGEVARIKARSVDDLFQIILPVVLFVFVFTLTFLALL